jgi:Rieske Fe-S protein
VSFSKYPNLNKSGGSASLKASGYSDPTCGQNGVIVVYQGPGEFLALSSSCTHACCAVSFNGSSLHCPCHGATFNLSGKCTNGVTSRALQTLPTCADANGVYVTV